MKRESAVASARKSKGEYKPIIVYPNGTTEVVEQNPERFDRNTKNGYTIKGDKYARGTTYINRDDAIAAAQKLIDFRLQTSKNNFAKFSDAQREKSKDRIEAELKLWGG